MNHQPRTSSRSDDVHLTEQPTVAAPDRTTRNPLAARAVSALTMLAGFWLAVSPFALDYTATDPGFDGRWNSVVVGVVLVLLAVVRTVVLDATPLLSLACVVLGAWLIIAPFVLGYNEGTDAPTVVGHHIAMGFIVMVTAGFSAAATYQYRRDVRHRT